MDTFETNTFESMESGPVKHLAYAIMGPALMSFPDIQNTLPIDPVAFSIWLNEQIETPENLEQYIEQQRSQRLGIYYETLWRYFLENFPGFDLITHNLPVRGFSSTLGEFDFIVRNTRTEQIYHVEIATKYYLSHKFDNTGYWLGPSLKDRFDIKANHLLNHQIVLSKTPEGKRALAELDVFNPTQVICVGGMLFYGKQACPLHPLTNAGHAHALHVSLNDFIDQWEHPCWMFVPRHDWLAPINIRARYAKIQNHNDIAQLINMAFSRQSQPLMIAKMTRIEAEEGYFQEQQRLFITPNDWHVQADQVLNDAFNTEI